MTLVEGATFCISGPDGDIVPGRAQGLYVRDTRVLSRWQLTVDGLSPEALAVNPGHPYTAHFIARVPPHPGVADSNLLVERRRYLAGGMREDLVVRNTASRPVTCQVRLAVASDFADLFEVKEGSAGPVDDVACLTTGDALQLSRHRGEDELQVRVRGGGNPAPAPGELCWTASIQAHQRWTVSIEAVAAVNGRQTSLRRSGGSRPERAAPARRMREWQRTGPVMHTADEDLATILARSVEDLGSLRIFDPDHPQRAVVAAGAPWFMALFGRDSLLTSWMLLPLSHHLALGTLQTLAAHQGTTENARTEEEPGRILHEMRFGPESLRALGGNNAYYGTADATPLFVMLVGELRRWGRFPDELTALLPHVDRALRWIEHSGDVDGDGFVEYQRKTTSGLQNQGWKDSWNGINFADGRIAEAPIALVEVQGYVYAAYRARAELAAEQGDRDGARHWDERAQRLKQSFNERFWLPDRGWYAVGLDHDKRPIDSLTSNIGHCLWTGIVDEDKAEAVADRLLSPEMFSGWGIRTLASSMGAYNPMSYHNGSIWPHDNAICAAGLMRYGFVDHAQRVAAAVLDAASCFAHRLPELFCGFPREDFGGPVPYPTSCSPQAWASAAPLLLLRSLLRFDPSATTGQLWCAPVVPDRYLPLRVTHVTIGQGDLTIDVPGRNWTVEGLRGSGVKLVRRARPPDGARSTGQRATDAESTPSSVQTGRP